VILYNDLKTVLWKVERQFGTALLLIKRFFCSIPNAVKYIIKGFNRLAQKGISETWHSTKKFYFRRKIMRNAIFQITTLSDDERNFQENTVFKQNIKISVIVPLYNTKETFLCEMIESVISQTYGNWELCLADGSNEAYAKVETICKTYAKNDSRIHYKKLSKNGGISYNTNKAIEMSTGSYIGLLDHDDLLHPSALFEVIKMIDGEAADLIYTDEMIFEGNLLRPILFNYKPDFAIDNLRSHNYLCHFCVYSKALYEKIGSYDSCFDGSQDYDMILRLSEQAANIVHISKILYYWRAHKNSVAGNTSAKLYAYDTAKVAIASHLNRLGLLGTVINSELEGMYKINYNISFYPLISIIIPNKDHVEDLKKCIDSIFNVSSYKYFEIVIVENNSELSETFSYYKEIGSKQNVRICIWENEFNFSAINNLGVENAKGDYVLLLNNDTEVISPNWLEEMLMFAQRDDVGAVGAKLYYHDDTVQHAGVIIGIAGFAGHSHKHSPRTYPGHMGRLKIAQNVSAVTGACMMMKRAIYDEVGGLDEAFVVALNDVDMCLRIRQKGYLNVFTPFAELYHYESKSRGLEDTPEKEKRFADEVELFRQRWTKELIEGDPYYNENLTLEFEDFSLSL